MEAVAHTNADGLSITFSLLTIWELSDAGCSSRKSGTRSRLIRDDAEEQRSCECSNLRKAGDLALFVRRAGYKETFRKILVVVAFFVDFMPNGERADNAL